MGEIVELRPFAHGEIRIDETLWDLKLAGLKRFRITREAMGRLFGASFPTQYISKLAKRNRHLENLGTVVTVTTVLRDRVYETVTYDPDEVYQFAVFSKLPRARHFLLHYIEFRDAVLTERPAPAPFSHPAWYLNRLATLAAMEPYQRGGRPEEVKRLTAESGKAPSTVYRHLGLIASGRAIKSKKGGPRGQWSITPDQRARMGEVIEVAPQVTGARLHRILGSPRRPSYSTIQRFRKATARHYVI